MIKLITLYLLTALFLFSSNIFAASSIRAGFNIWQQNPTGDIKYEGDSLNLDRNLDINKSHRSVAAYFHVKNAILFVPETIISYESFEYNGTTNSIKTFGLVTFEQNANARIKYMAFSIAALYAFPINKYFGTKIGAELRKLDFSVMFSGRNASTKKKTAISFGAAQETGSFLILAYLNANVKLLDNRVHAYTDIKYSHLYDNELLSYKLGVGLKVLPMVMFEAGQKKITLISKNDATDLDIGINIQGSFIDISYLF